jgi:hypothetical protein
MRREKTDSGRDGKGGRRDGKRGGIVGERKAGTEVEGGI